MKNTEAGCYLEVNVATGNIERIAVDPKEMAQKFGTPAASINDACAGFCQHSLESCLRLTDAGKAKGQAKGQAKGKPA